MHHPAPGFLRQIGGILRARDATAEKVEQLGLVLTHEGINASVAGRQRFRSTAFSRRFQHIVTRPLPDTCNVPLRWSGVNPLPCKIWPTAITPVGKDDRPHEHRVPRWTNTRAAANPTFLGAVAPGDDKNWTLITSANAYRGFRPSEKPARLHDGGMGGYSEFGKAFWGSRGALGSKEGMIRTW